MRIRYWLVIVIATGVLSACASTGVGGRAGGPDAVARLERARALSPSSEPVLRALGIAYYKNGKPTEARAALEQAVKLNARDGTAVLYLGLTAEAQGDLPAARTAYASYVDFGRTSRVRRSLEARLAALQRREIQETAKAQISQEQRLAAIPGTANVVAVMPLSFSGADTSLKPLERGFAELLTTDLAHSSQLTVVERLRIQALIDEIKLQGGGATNASTNVRAGKMLHAGRLVQGSILQQGPQLRVDAAVVEVPTTRVAGSTNDDRALDELLTLEKNIALGLFQQLGITLTVTERNTIEQRPTRSLAAFLAYSRGLLSEDEGRFEDADRFYQNAVRLDPGFAAAQQKSRQTENIIAGNQVTAQSIEGALAGTQEGRIVQEAVEGFAVGAGGSEGSTALAIAGDLNPTVVGAAAANASGALTSPPFRDPASLGTGIEIIGQKTAKIEIVVKRP